MDPISTLMALMEGVDKAPSYVIPPKKASKVKRKRHLIIRDEKAWFGGYIYSYGEVTGISYERDLLGNLDASGRLDEPLVIDGMEIPEGTPYILVRPPNLGNKGLPSAPMMVDLYVTMRCNLRCLHCGYSCGPGMAGDPLGLEDWKEILNILERVGVLQVRIQGGEPLLRRDIVGILEHAGKKAFSVWLFTNGTLINREIIEVLERYPIKLSISLDGALPSTHDEFRGVRGTFNRVMKSLRMLKEAGVYFILNAVINRLNFQELEDIVDLAADVGAAGVSFVSLNYVGRALHNERIRLTPHDLREAARRILERGKEVSDRGMYVSVQYKSPHTDQELEEFHASKFLSGRDLPEPFAGYLRGKLVCPAGILRACVAPNGDLYPCEVCLVDVDRCSRFRAGNLLEDDFYEIWYENWSELRNGFFPSDLECLGCAHRENCGMKVCRLYPLVTRGNLKLAPPECGWYYLEGGSGE